MGGLLFLVFKSVLLLEIIGYGRLLANRVKIVDAEPFMEVEHPILNLEADEYIPGNLLYSSYLTLFTTDGIDIDPVVGINTTEYMPLGLYQDGDGLNASFNGIYSFVQITPSQVVIVDHHSHCLRLIDRSTLQVDTLVGKCTSDGYADGWHEEARFNLPYQALVDERNKNTLLISDQGNQAVRLVDLTSLCVSTLLKSEDISSPRSMIFGLDENALLVATTGNLMRISLNDRKSEVFFKQDHLTETALDPIYDTPSHMIKLSPTLLATSINTYKAIKVIDITNKENYDVCYEILPDSEHCRFGKSHGIAIVGDSLYISDTKNIFKLEEPACVAPSYDSAGILPSASVPEMILLLLATWIAVIHAM